MNPSPSHSFRWSHCTGFGFSVSSCKLPLGVYFTYGNACVFRLFSQILTFNCLHSIWIPPKLAPAISSFFKLQTAATLASVQVLTDSSKSYESVPLNVSDGPRISPQAWDHHGFGCHLQGIRKSMRHSNLPPGLNWSCPVGTSRVFLARFHLTRGSMAAACTSRDPGRRRGRLYSVTNVIVFTNR